MALPLNLFLAKAKTVERTEPRQMFFLPMSQERYSIGKCEKNS